MIEKIKKYKLIKGTNEGLILYKDILINILDNYKNLMNLLRSSIVVNMFLSIENINNINSMSPSEVKRLFRIGNSVNLLQYHRLVIEKIENKDKIIKILCNKILLACRLDLYGEGKFVDLYSEIENKNEEKQDEIIKIHKIKKTVRGGLKKRKKQKRVL